MLAHPPDHHPFSAQALPDAELLLTNLIEQIRPHVTPETGIVGIHTGGVWLAERIHAALGIISPLGTLDVSFYRDDFTKTGMRRHVKSSDVPFAVDGARMLIVDDVLFTGRTWHELWKNVQRRLTGNVKAQNQQQRAKQRHHAPATNAEIDQIKHHGSTAC